MTNKQQWRFPPNNGGIGQGFNDGALDHFKGHRLSSMVREVIQNSLDARRDSNQPVKICIEIKRIPRSECPEVNFIKRHIESSLEMAQEQNLPDVEKFYKNSLTRISDDSEVRFLAIHDYNTTGLEGPLDRSTGSWYALVKGSGISQKSAGSLGSFGHGSKAPFTLSAIRSIFYLSYVAGPLGLEKRFQGKSILQSHSDPDSDDGSQTQGTGFYGWSTNCHPLTNEQIPTWADQIRSVKFHESGTTILIPHYQLTEDEEPEIAITVIANFFYAIMEGHLEIEIGNETTLNKTNIFEKYSEYENRLEHEQSEIDIDRIRENFLSLTAITKSTEQGIQEVPEMGSFRWYIRVDDNLERFRVALARQNGMLIRHNPKSLERFPLKKPFEMFVCVEGSAGSDLLKRVENPTHDDFEFARIEDPSDRDVALKNYIKLTKKIREIIDRFASIDSEDEILDDTLNNLFSSISESATPGESNERSTVIVIRQGAFQFRQKTDTSKHGDEGTGITGGQGHRGGSGKKLTEGGSIPGPGKGKVTGSTKKSTSSQKFVPLQNLRIIANVKEPEKIRIIFDNPGEGEAELVLLRVGEEGSERVRILGPDGEETEQWVVELGEEPRQQLDLIVATGEHILDYALEARHAIKEEEADA